MEEVLGAIGRARLRPTRLRALGLAFSQLSSSPQPMWWKLVRDFVAAGEPEWCRAPELAAIGHHLVQPGNDEALRVWACTWLSHFWSQDTVACLARVLGDRTTPQAVRNQAAWTLSFRQLQERDDVLFVSADVERAADDALLSAWDAGAWKELPQLVSGARHSRDARLFERFARGEVPLETATQALEAFATPELGRLILRELPRVRAEERVRMVRLAGATLGDEAVAPLLAFAPQASIGARVEALFTAFALDQHAAGDAVRDFLGSLSLGATFEARARWHEANPGVLPVVRALRTARVTGTLTAEERGPLCAAAAADFAALGAIAPYAEQYVTDLWRHVAFRARHDAPAEVVRCVEAIPSALDDALFLREPYLDALAAAGRFRRLAQTAREHGSSAWATWLCAQHGRPLLALAARRSTRVQTVASLAGEALALATLGREDLARQALFEDLPPAEPLWGQDGAPPFPGPDERWRLEHEPERHRLLAAVVAHDLDALRAMQLAPGALADPDATDRGPLDALSASLDRNLDGQTVVLLGRFADEQALRAWLAGKGATVASGPFARAKFYIVGDGADAAALATMKSQGAVSLPLPSTAHGEPSC